MEGGGGKGRDGKGEKKGKGRGKGKGTEGNHVEIRESGEGNQVSGNFIHPCGVHKAKGKVFSSSMYLFFIKAFKASLRLSQLCAHQQRQQSWHLKGGTYSAESSGRFSGEHSQDWTQRLRLRLSKEKSTKQNYKTF